MFELWFKEQLVLRYKPAVAVAEAQDLEDEVEDTDIGGLAKKRKLTPKNTNSHKRKPKPKTKSIIDKAGSQVGKVNKQEAATKARQSEQDKVFAFVSSMPQVLML